MDLSIPPLYDTEAKILIHRARAAAEKAHNGQTRVSGEPYVVHPIATAEILMELPARTEVVCVGLLHDVLEDTPVGYIELETEWGSEIARLTNAVTKTKKLERVDKNDADEKRKAVHHQFLDTIKDPRAALVKLADRLHNCRTLAPLPAERQHALAEETLKMYVPLARQMGLALWERELAMICLDVLPKWDYQAALALSTRYEAEIAGKGYHQNKLDLCLL
jgi:GTP pyrophosphokinase